MPISPINSDSCVRRYIAPANQTPAPTNNTTQNSTVSSLNDSDSIKAQVKEQIAAQKAEWKKQRESLENDLKKVGEEFENLYWYEKVYYSVYYGVKALALQIQIERLAYLERTDTTALEAQLTKAIEDFIKEFETASKGDPDKQISNPFNPNAPKLTYAYPVVDARGRTGVGGGGGMSIGTWLIKGAAFFFGEWLPLQFQLSLYSVLK